MGPEPVAAAATSEQPREEREPCCSRAELCGALLALEEEREALRGLALRQRAELAAFERGRGRLNAELAEAERLLQAGLACEDCARSCAEDLARTELQRLSGERRHLERELDSRRAASAAVAAAVAAAGAPAEAEAWSAERQSLERALSEDRARLCALLEDQHGGGPERRARMASLQAARRAAAALREELAEQRLRRAGAEHGLCAAQAELGDLLERRRQEGSRARQQLLCEAEARRQQAEELHAAVSELGSLRQEVQDTATENARLREGIRWTLDGLVSIRRQSGIAEAYAAASLGGPAAC